MTITRIPQNRIAQSEFQKESEKYSLDLMRYIEKKITEVYEEITKKYPVNDGETKTPNPRSLFNAVMHVFICNMVGTQVVHLSGNEAARSVFIHGIHEIIKLSSGDLSEFMGHGDDVKKH